MRKTTLLLLAAATLLGCSTLISPAHTNPWDPDYGVGVQGPAPRISDWVLKRYEGNTATDPTVGLLSGESGADVYLAAGGYYYFDTLEVENATRDSAGGTERIRAITVVVSPGVSDPLELYLDGQDTRSVTYTGEINPSESANIVSANPVGFGFALRPATTDSTDAQSCSISFSMEVTYYSDADEPDDTSPAVQTNATTVQSDVITNFQRIGLFLDTTGGGSSASSGGTTATTVEEGSASFSQSLQADVSPIDPRRFALQFATDRSTTVTVTNISVAIPMYLEAAGDAACPPVDVTISDECSSTASNLALPYLGTNLNRSADWIQPGQMLFAANFLCTLTTNSNYAATYDGETITVILDLVEPDNEVYSTGAAWSVTNTLTLQTAGSLTN